VSGVKHRRKSYPPYARRITETETMRRSWTSGFLKAVLDETHVTLHALAQAYGGAEGGDVRSTLRAYRDGNRAITAGPAFLLGEALRRLGVTWLNGGVVLYASATSGSGCGTSNA